PVRVEPHTEVGQIAAEYNRVLTAIGRRTESIQVLRRTAAAANESSSVEQALSVALDEVCALTGWPIGHALLVSRDDPAQLVSSGVWRMTDERRYAAFREATENEPLPIPDSLAGAAVATGKPVLVSTADFRGDPARSMTVSVVSIETTAADDDD